MSKVHMWWWPVTPEGEVPDHPPVGLGEAEMIDPGITFATYPESADKWDLLPRTERFIVRDGHAERLPPWRVRLYARRHPYGYLAWAWEVYDPTRPVGRQVITGGGWHKSWDRACREGLRALRELTVGPHR